MPQGQPSSSPTTSRAGHMQRPPRKPREAPGRSALSGLRRYPAERQPTLGMQALAPPGPAVAPAPGTLALAPPGPAVAPAPGTLAAAPSGPASAPAPGTVAPAPSGPAVAPAPGTVAFAPSGPASAPAPGTVAPAPSGPATASAPGTAAFAAPGPASAPTPGAVAQTVPSALTQPGGGLAEASGATAIAETAAPASRTDFKEIFRAFVLSAMRSGLPTPAGSRNCELGPICRARYECAGNRGNRSTGTAIRALQIERQSRTGRRSGDADQQHSARALGNRRRRLAPLLPMTQRLADFLRVAGRRCRLVSRSKCRGPPSEACKGLAVRSRS
jgi:hypothetical protein